MELKIWDMLRREHKLEYINIAWCAYDCEFKPNKIVYRVKSWDCKRNNNSYYWSSDLHKGEIKRLWKIDITL